MSRSGCFACATCSAEGGNYVVLPHGRELVSYYANSVAHLLGPYADAVRARDSLPAEDLSG